MACSTLGAHLRTFPERQDAEEAKRFQQHEHVERHHTKWEAKPAEPAVHGAAIPKRRKQIAGYAPVDDDILPTEEKRRLAAPHSILGCEEHDAHLHVRDDVEAEETDGEQAEGNPRDVAPKLRRTGGGGGRTGLATICGELSPHLPQLFLEF